MFDTTCDFHEQEMQQETQMLKEMSEQPSSIQQEIRDGEKRLQEILVAKRDQGFLDNKHHIDGDMQEDKVSDRDLLDHILMLQGGLGGVLMADQHQQENDDDASVYYGNVEDDIAVEKMIHSLHSLPR